MSNTVQDILQKQLEYSGVASWHRAGRTGQGINIWNTEGTGPHSSKVQIRLDTGAPDANLYQVASHTEYDNEKVTAHYCEYDGKKYDIEEFLDKYKIDVVTRSVAGGQTVGTPLSLYWIGLREKYNLILFNSGGNHNNGPIAGGSLPSDVAYWVSQCKLNKNGRPIYSWDTASPGPEIDFCDFPGFYDGTSFCGPFTAARAAIMKGFYGKEMYHDEIFKYLVMCCQDLEEPGPDDKVGHGLPIMPDPKRKYISLNVGSNKYKVDGTEKTLDISPVNKDGNVFVPLRVIGEALGKEFSYKAISNGIVYVEIKDDKKLVQLTTESPYLWINGTKKSLDFAPFILGGQQGRTMVPIRAIAEAFGCKVDWVQKRQRVMILEA